MKFLRTGGYRLVDKVRSSKIRKELNIDVIEEGTSEYRTNWTNHIKRRESTRLSNK